MKTILEIAMLLAFLVAGGSLVFAQNIGPSYDPFVYRELRKNREYQQKQDEKQEKSDKERVEATKEAEQRRGAEADAKMREQEKARMGEEAKESHTTNQEYRNKIRTGQLPAPADWGNPDYCVSPAVKRDRRIPIDVEYLKCYAIRDGRVEEAFWRKERDGALMLVDPHISQNLR